MANTYELEIEAQPSIYTPAERSMLLCFAEPEDGVNEATGMLLIIAGYAGVVNSKIYSKMRKEFADNYNLVTVQCDYFGYEYMQNNHPVEVSLEELEDSLSDAELELLQRDYDKYEHILKGKKFIQQIELGEHLENFNDMGMMQAVDNLRSVKVVLDIIKDNQYKINENRIYAYGFSHGAYLAYLCNALWPELFTAIIDNSGYLIPYHLRHERLVDYVYEGMQICQIVKYRALEYIQDEQILQLPWLYQQFENQAGILCYAGEDDNMTSLEEKKTFLNQVEHSKIVTITKYNVNMENFTTTEHELGADFIKLFDLAYRTYLQPKEKEWKKRKKKHRIVYENVSYETALYRYELRWENEIPMLYRLEK